MPPISAISRVAPPVAPVMEETAPAAPARELEVPLAPYTAGLPTRVELPDPAPLDRHRGLSSLPTHGPLFGGEPSADDVRQGRIADCFAASALAAVAHVRPDLIRRAVREMPDGTYVVCLYTPGESRPRLVRVDADFYGLVAPIYAHGTHNELWPALIEKALAGDSYETLGAGGRAAGVMAALTGFSPRIGTPSSFASPADFFAFVQRQMDAHMPMTLGTPRETDPATTGLHGWHSYTVLGAVERDGVQYVQLRNPWGRSEPGDDGADDGVFLLPVADAMRLFSSFHTTVR